MPKRSSFASAYSRHSARTSQPEQMRFASRVEPPFSGKNASGSVWAHNARSCQSGSSAGSTATSGSRRRSIETGSTA